MYANDMQSQELHDRAGTAHVKQDRAREDRAPEAAGGGRRRTVCLVRSRANWRRRSCPGRVSGERPASKEILRRLLLLRAVNCVPLPRFIVQLLAPDHFASQLGVEGMADVGFHAKRGARQN